MKCNGINSIITTESWKVCGVCVWSIYESTSVLKLCRHIDLYVFTCRICFLFVLVISGKLISDICIQHTHMHFIKYMYVQETIYTSSCTSIVTIKTCKCKNLSDKLFVMDKMWKLTTVKSNELPHDKTNKMACASSKDSDQPRHPPSLISVFTVCMKKPWIERTAKTLIRLGRCPVWSESSLGAQSFCWFCRAVAQIGLWYSSREE